MKKLDPLVPAFGISTSVLGVKKYISDGVLKSNNSILPIFHKDEQYSKPFLNELEAEQYISKIDNVFNREYSIVPVMVPKKNLKPVSLPGAKIS
jgi:hypothetical protein